MLGLYDLDYQILLFLDIHSLENACRTNKQYRYICRDNNFWVDKFMLDSIPLPVISPDNIQGWINAYKLNARLKYLNAYIYLEELEPYVTRDVVGYMQTYL